MCKLTKYVRKCVIFLKINTADKKFTRPPVATVATNSKAVSMFPMFSELLECNLLLNSKFNIIDDEVEFNQKVFGA